MKGKVCGATALLLCLCLGSAGSLAAQEKSERQRTVALTFDDLPKGGRVQDLDAAQAANRDLLAVLTARKVPAIGFVNENKLYAEGEVDARIALLRMWLDAGMALGNHTYSHISLHDNPLWKFEDDVVRGEAVTRRLLEERGQSIRYFRHPYNRTGRTREIRDEFVAFLQQRGYVVAPFTVEHADYMFNTVYVRARQKGDDALAARVRRAYVAHLDTAFDHLERLSREVLGYEPPQIFLLHVNEINAAAMEEMIARLRARGYRFVSLNEALEHRAYRLKDGYAGRAGVSWLHRWAVGLGQPNRFREDPDPPKFIIDLYNAR